MDTLSEDQDVVFFAISPPDHESLARLVRQEGSATSPAETTNGKFQENPTSPAETTNGKLQEIKETTHPTQSFQKSQDATPSAETANGKLHLHIQLFHIACHEFNSMSPVFEKSSVSNSRSAVS